MEKLDAATLRLGNNIFHNGKVVRVVSLDWDLEDESEPLIKVDTLGMEKNAIGGSWKKFIELNETNFNPIPLTEEWLLKMGLKETFDECSFEISVSINNRHSVINASWEPEISVDIYTTNPYKEDGSWLNTNVKYVHQLQNLYFAITGEELTVK